MASIMGTIGAITGGITNAVMGDGSQGLSNAESDFLRFENQQQANELQYQEGLQAQQQQFNDTMQTASEASHETATVQTWAADVANARNTLSSSDLQQIK